MTAREATETWWNGNISDFKTWLKHATKVQVLEALQVALQMNIDTAEILIDKFQHFLLGFEYPEH